MLTWAEIDLKAISHNLRQIKNMVEPAGSKVLAVVKDNAYGHGAVQVARVAADLSVQMLGVAVVEEALELRRAGLDLPILVFGCVLDEQAADIVRNDISQTVCDLRICRALSREADRQKKQVRVHIKVDTGMGRIGIMHDLALDLVKNIAKIPGIVIEGISTHFASADADEEFTTLQLERFNSLILSLKAAGIHIPLRHAANSAAILCHPSTYLDMVRPGLAIYGLYPVEFSCDIDLKPALSLKTRIVYLKEVPTGWDISYSRTYTTRKPSKIASLAIGYGHGYNRKLSNTGEAIIRGIKAPIVGAVCMDQCLCDVTHVPGVSIGDEAVLIGRQGDEEITTDEVAQKVGTISYEILCAINSSVPRVYSDDR